MKPYENKNLLIPALSVIFSITQNPEPEEVQDNQRWQKDKSQRIRELSVKCVS